jgi:hypothetical protein
VGLGSNSTGIATSVPWLFQPFLTWVHKLSDLTMTGACKDASCHLRPCLVDSVSLCSVLRHWYNLGLSQVQNYYISKWIMLYYIT